MNGLNHDHYCLECGAREGSAHVIQELAEALRSTENWLCEYDLQNGPDSGAQELLANVRAALAKAGL